MAVPPDFVAGDVLTAAQMNKVGFWLVKSQTIGTAVSSVTVSDAFSADYTSYRVVVTGGAASTTGINLLMTLGATVTGYYYGAFGLTYGGVVTNGGGNNTTSIPVARAATDGLFGQVDIHNPQLADQTVFTGAYGDVYANAAGIALNITGFLNNTTQYTAFTLTTSTGTITGGTIYVYGWRD